MHRLIFFLCSFLVFSHLSATLKTIKDVYGGEGAHWVGDGFKVNTFFPSRQLNEQQTSPFVLLDYNAKDVFPPSLKQRGVGPHPHRGFETVTFVYEGAVAHRDSSGSFGVVKEGDIQWMTAGKGVLHEEFHEKEYSKKGGPFHAVQLWVNLPAKDKLCDPRYQTLRDHDIRRVQVDDQGSFIRIVAGELNGVRGAASTHTPIEVYDIFLKKGSKVRFNLPETYNTLLLVMNGQLNVNGKSSREKELVAFERYGDEVVLFAKRDSFALLMSGKPLNEPVARSGPFVMNTEEEIKQAWDDYHAGLFGILK